MIPEHAEWLMWRRQHIGASDVAAIVGISPWASPYSVWSSKIHGGDDDDSEAMEAGRMLESAVTYWFQARTGLYVAQHQECCVHPVMPWAGATLDGRVYESPWAEDAESIATLEVKCTSDSAKAWETDGVPAMYQAQAQWQMFVTGAPATFFAVLHASFGLRLRVYRIDRDEEDIRLLVDRVSAFHRDHILTRIPPVVDGHPATTEALKRIDSAPSAGVLLDDDAVKHWHRALQLTEDVAHLEEALDAEKNALRAALGPYTDGYVDGQRICTWRPQERTSIDVTALRERLPHLAARFTKTTPIRVLRIVKPKEGRH